MGPGCKLTSGKRQASEAPLTEYEKERAQTVLRNNQILHRLGVPALSSIVNGLSGKKKGTSLEPRHTEYDEGGLLDKRLENAPDNSMTITKGTCYRGSKGSKRVMAVEDQVQPPRITRHRTKELQSINEGLEGSTANSDDCPAQPDDQMEICNEAQESVMVQRCSRGQSMGKELDRITRGLNAKIPVHIVEGKKRPEVPIQAAKLASEGGIILRQHIPILPHWKDYKKDETQDHLKNYMGKVAVNFDIDTNNKAVIDACTDLLKGGQRQMRYKLKKLYLYGIPANEVRTTSPLVSMTDEEWRTLVTMWSSAKHKEKCMKNRENREKVQFQQKTGSRCFVAHCHAVKQDKYKDMEPTSIDLFKECHCSSKNGFSEPIQKAIKKAKNKSLQLKFFLKSYQDPSFFKLPAL